MKLILIRHTSVAVARGVCYGQTDVDLAASFGDEAAAVREKLSGYHFDKVFSSPLSRCLRLADSCGYPNPVVDDRLIEMNFGEWEMKRYDDIDDPRLREWFDDYINVAVPGGESVIDQRNRFVEFVEELRQNNQDSTIGVFTHGGILINALVAFGGKTYGEVYSSIPPYGSVIEIDV